MTTTTTTTRTPTTSTNALARARLAPAFLLAVALVGCGPMVQPGGDASTPPGSDASTPPGGDSSTPPGSDGAVTPPPADGSPPPPPDGSTVPPSDAGEPPEGTIRVATSCPAFTPCGGDPSGSWRYTTVCVAPPLEALRAMCPGFEVTGSGTVRGGVAFAAGMVTRNVSGTYRMMMTVPASCAVVGCGVIQGALRSAGYPDAACAQSASRGCDCTATGTSSSSQTSGYTVTGNTITTSSGLTYDFCVRDGAFTYRETSASPSEPWIAEMARR